VSVLRDVIAATDPALSAHAVPVPPAGRFQLEDAARRFVLEAVYEGYLMHYGEPRAFAGMEPDLRLLAGDALYALGLARLADAGDLEAVVELADLISLCACAHAQARPEVAEELWRASARLLGGEPGPGARGIARDRLQGAG
jgi:hypothetical protein